MINLPVAYKSQWDSDAGETNNDCGPCSVAMVLNFYGEKLTTNEVFKRTGAGLGMISNDQLAKAISSFGYTFQISRRASVMALKVALDSGKPVIALVHYGSLTSRQDTNFNGGHFFTVVGYREDGYFVNDPNFRGDMRSHGDHHFYTKAEFEKAWADSALDFNTPNTMIVIDRKPTSAPIVTPPAAFTDQTLIPLNFESVLEKYGQVELGTLRSQINDKDKTIKQLQDKLTAISDAAKFAANAKIGQ